MGSIKSSDVDAPAFEVTEEMVRKNGLRVWIDPDLCTGDGLCAEIDDDLFEIGDDGIACVKQNGDRLDHVVGEPMPIVEVPANKPTNGSRDRDHVVLVGEAAEECPGECIFVELVDAHGGPNIPLPLGTIEKALEPISL